MSAQLLQCLIVLFALTQATSEPLSLIQPDHPPLAAELSSRLAARAARQLEPKVDARLPAPSAQDLEAIRKVAQVLVMLGEQVIPALINGPGSGDENTTVIPNDIVDKD